MNCLSLSLWTSFSETRIAASAFNVPTPRYRSGHLLIFGSRYATAPFDPKDGYEKIEGFFVYPLNCASVSITFAKVIPPDPLPEEVGERFEFSWIVPKDRPWKVGDRLAIKFFEFGELLQ